jgi:hypothetical protein
MKRSAAILVLLTLAIGGATCQMTPLLSLRQGPASQPKAADLPPVPDRLRGFYQELQANKFEVIADFEQAPQVQIFHVDGAGKAQITVQRNRLATGAGALEVRLDEPAAALLIDDQKAKDWALPRDWHRYELLMASIFAPTQAVAHLQIRSGTEQPATWEAPPLPLQRGWNLVRIDLADVARQLDLADVRQIRLAIQADQWPLTIDLDDLMLADNTATVYGQPQGPEGNLYVLKKGRRTHVGVTGRFELVFARGVLAGWYDLSEGADKTLNLAGAGPAGPVLTALDDSGAPLGGIGIDSWLHLGSNIQTQLQIVETNSLAVTLKGTIRLAGHGTDAVEAVSRSSATSEAVQDQLRTDETTHGPGPRLTTPRPQDHGTQNAELLEKKAFASAPSDTQLAGGAIEQVYVYTVRRDGRVFVDIRAQVASAQFTPAGIGLAVTGLPAVMDARQIDPLDRNMVGQRAATPAPTGADSAQAMASAEVHPPIPRALLLARSHSNGTNLLLVPSNVGVYQRVVTASRQTGQTAAYMYVMDKPASDKVHLATMLAVWPPDLKDLPTAAAIARDYQEPTPPVVEVGRLRTDIDGDLDGDGFAEGSGCWTLAPDGQALRLRWPAGRLRFWPMLEVTNIAGKKCWPYLDGRIIKPVETRSGGEALFVVPEILSRPALLEVTIEK